MSEVQNKRQLRQLGGLKSKTGQHQPPSRASASNPDTRNQDEDQDKQSHAEERIAQPPVHGRRQEGTNNQRHQTCADSYNLFTKEVGAIAEALLGVEITGTQHHSYSQCQQCGDRQQQPFIHRKTTSPGCACWWASRTATSMSSTKTVSVSVPSALAMISLAAPKSSNRLTPFLIPSRKTP